MALPVNPITAFVKKLPKPLQNRYYLSTLIFVFILTFLDKNNLYTQFKLFRAVNNLESDLIFYRDKIQEVKLEAENFEFTKERYAREKYYMKRRGEDVFVIRNE